MVRMYIDRGTGLPAAVKGVGGGACWFTLRSGRGAPQGRKGARMVLEGVGRSRAARAVFFFMDLLACASGAIGPGLRMQGASLELRNLPAAMRALAPMDSYLSSSAASSSVMTGPR